MSTLLRQSDWKGHTVLRMTGHRVSDGDCFRLVGEVDGLERRMPLAHGRNGVGSKADNSVRLACAGISRCHAEIELSTEGLVLRDLASKNGTFVNGERIAEARVELGDRLRFGPVVMVLESAPADDVEIAIDLSVAPSGGSASPLSTMTRFDRPEEACSEDLAAIDALLETPGVESGLAAFVGELGASSAVLVESFEGAQVVLATAGSAIDLVTISALLGDEDEDGYRVAGEAGQASMTMLGEDGRALSLVVVGDRPGRSSSATLLRIALRLTAARLKVVPLRVSNPDEASALSFPRDLVRGEAPPMRRLYDQIKDLTQGDLPVLLVGETGVGKEHLARVLHDSSARREGPFVALNCAAIPTELLEAELFGIGRGVATGVEARIGRLELADGGTLFLDEVGDMALPLQAKVLRALQEREVNPVGSRRSNPFDVRLVAATNRDLEAMIAGGDFRRDLYYRLAGFVLEVPSLRHRKADIPRLVEHFLRKSSAEIGKSVRGITVRALQALIDRPWVGNIRELEHELRRLVYSVPAGAAIDSAMITPATVDDHDLDGSLELAERLARLESRLIRAALERTDGNLSQAAEELGISRNGLKQKIQRLGLASD